MNEGDIFAVFHTAAQKYCAYQACKVWQGSAAFLCLDYFSKKAPHETDLESMRPLRQYRFDYNGEYSYRIYEYKNIPNTAIFLGYQKPFVLHETNQYSGLQFPNGNELYEEAQWCALPEETRKSYKNACSDSSKVLIGGKAYRKNESEIFISVSKAIPVHELDRLPKLALVTMDYFEQKIINYFYNRPLVINYTLETNTETCLDFESTHFQYIQIPTDDCLKRVRLPECAKVLSFTDKVMSNIELYDMQGGYLCGFSEAG